MAGRKDNSQNLDSQCMSGIMPAFPQFRLLRRRGRPVSYIFLFESPRFMHSSRLEVGQGGIMWLHLTYRDLSGLLELDCRLQISKEVVLKLCSQLPPIGKRHVHRALSSRPDPQQLTAMPGVLPPSDVLVLSRKSQYLSTRIPGAAAS